VATTLVFGEQVAVYAALGFVVREFTLNTSTLNGDDVFLLFVPGRYLYDRAE
jgi:hypothetical protein